MSNSFLTRLRSQVRQQGLQAEAAASVLGRPKTPCAVREGTRRPLRPAAKPFCGGPRGQPAKPSAAALAISTAGRVFQHADTDATGGTALGS